MKRIKSIILSENSEYELGYLRRVRLRFPHLQYPYSDSFPNVSVSCALRLLFF